MIRLILVIFLFSTPAFAYDDRDWSKVENEEPEFTKYYEVNLTLRIAFMGSQEALQEEWFLTHGTLTSENVFCLFVAGGKEFIPEIWVRVKINKGEVYPHISCFGHEVLHILKTLGLKVVNPDRGK